jgi:uncharacterized radical SAM protein YgiQ
VQPQDKNRFIPATREEFDALDWGAADIIIVSGDAYVDHPAFGTAVIARVLENAGYRVAVIDQPDIDDPESVAVFGKPKLFFGVTAGNVDSLLSRYTAFHKVRNDDPFTPADVQCPRPERASIFYTNMVKRIFKDTPVVLGGVEASMRRFMHYDFKTDKLRRSIIEDSRADILVYGMGEKPVIEIARRIAGGEALGGISGTVFMEREVPVGAVVLPTEENAMENRELYTEVFKTIYLNGDKTIAQGAAKRFVVQYPPVPFSQKELDAVYDLPFTREVHPKYKGKKIPAYEMIRDSITSHRGCASGCAFCSLALHQGRRIISRSRESLMREVKRLAASKSFHGHITDIGGPSANMYNSRCNSKTRCTRISCLYPNLCAHFEPHTSDWLDLLDEALTIPGVKHVTVGSGVRYDLFMKDNPALLKRLVNHVSGNLKVAPEHVEEQVLHVMRKVPLYPFEKFVKEFEAAAKTAGKKYYIIPYLMSNHPGSTMNAMREMKYKLTKSLGRFPEQVQSFIPLPMTLSSVIYYTGKDPFTGETVFSEKDMSRRRKQHEIFFE